MTIGRINKYPEQNFFFMALPSFRRTPLPVFFAVTGALFLWHNRILLLILSGLCLGSRFNCRRRFFRCCISQCEDGQLITDNLLQIRIGHFPVSAQVIL